MLNIAIDGDKIIAPFKKWSSNNVMTPWCIYGIDDKLSHIEEVKIAGKDVPDRSKTGHLQLLFDEFLARAKDGKGSIGFVKMHAFGYSNIVKISYVPDTLKTKTKMGYANAVKVSEEAFAITVHVAAHDPSDLTLENWPVTRF
eukprot:UN26397